MTNIKVDKVNWKNWIKCAITATSIKWHYRLAKASDRAWGKAIDIESKLVDEIYELAHSFVEWMTSFEHWLVIMGDKHERAADDAYQRIKDLELADNKTLEEWIDELNELSS